LIYHRNENECKIQFKTKLINKFVIFFLIVMLNVKISEFKFKILKNVINNDLILQLIFKINQVIIFLIVLV